MDIFAEPLRKVYVHPADELCQDVEVLKLRVAFQEVPEGITSIVDLVQWLKTSHGVADVLMRSGWMRLPQGDSSLLPATLTLHVRQQQRQPGPTEVFRFALSSTEWWNAVVDRELNGGHLQDHASSILVPPGLELPDDIPGSVCLKWPLLVDEGGGDIQIYVVEHCAIQGCECKHLDFDGTYHAAPVNSRPRRNHIPRDSSGKYFCYIEHARCILRINHMQRQYCGRKRIDGPATLQAFICHVLPNKACPDVCYCKVGRGPDTFSSVAGTSGGKRSVAGENWNKGRTQAWNFRVAALQEVFDVKSPPNEPIWRGSVVFGDRSVEFFSTYTSLFGIEHKQSLMFRSDDIEDDANNGKWVVWDGIPGVSKLLQEFAWGVGMEAKLDRPFALNKFILKAAGAPGPDHRDDRATFCNGLCCIDMLETLYWKPDRAVVRGKLTGQAEELVIKLAWESSSAEELGTEVSALSDIQQCGVVPKVVAHGPLVLTPSGLRIHLATALSPVGVDLHCVEIHGSQLCLLACRLLEALAYLQTTGRKHRDVKPQNVIQYNVDGRVDYMLVDYGAAWKTDGNDSWFSDPVWGPTYCNSPLADCESLVYTLVTVSGRNLPWEGLDSLAAYHCRTSHQGMYVSTFHLEQESPALGSFAFSVMEMSAAFSEPKFDTWIKMLGKHIDPESKHASNSLRAHSSVVLV